MDRLRTGKGIPAGLPSGWDPIKPAKSNEEEGFLAAVAVSFLQAIFTDIANGRVFDGEAVLDVLGDPVVKFPGPKVGIGFISGNLLRKSADLWRENNVRSFTG